MIAAEQNTKPQNRAPGFAAVVEKLAAEKKEKPAWILDSCGFLVRLIEFESATFGVGEL
jgi:hypothetical protein